MMKYCVLLLTSLAFLIQTDVTRAADWVMDTEKSKLEYSIQVQGNKIQGNFGDFKTQIKLDPENLSDANIVVRVNTSSIVTGNSQGDSFAKSLQWLGVESFPEAVFTSTSIVSAGGNSFSANGELAIKEITYPLKLDFTLDVEGGTATAKGAITLDRTELSVGPAASGSLPVENAVTVSFEVYATR